MKGAPVDITLVDRQNHHLFQPLLYQLAIGRSRAVAQVGKFEMPGFPAWVARLFIQLMFLVGFHDKLFVFLDWPYAYASFNRGARLIIRSDSDHVPGDCKPSTNKRSPLIQHD